MRKIYSALLTSVCVLCCSLFAHAQETIWGTLDSYNSDNFPSGVFYVNMDGSNITRPLPTGPGLYEYGVRQLFRGRDGNVYGLSYNEAGHLFFRITKDGVFPIYQHGYAEGGEMAEADDGYFYKFGSGAAGDHIVISRIKADGSGYAQNSFYKPSYRPAKLIVSGGAIYGLNQSGGANAGSGYMYKFTPGADLSGLEILYNFSAATGRKPAGGLTEGSDGFLYGVTSSGGANDSGVIFKISKNGTQYSKLYDFTYATGRYPASGLVLDATGWMYGTTPKGGQYQKGVIYKVRTDGSNYTVLHHFSAALAGPFGESVLHNGYLYGYENKMYGSAGNSLLYRLRLSDNTFETLTTFPDGAYASGNESELFIVDNPFIPNVYVTTPANNSTVSSKNLRFKFNPIQGATLYTLELSLAEDFAQVVGRAQSSNPEFIASDLKANTKYYARVKTNVWPAFGLVTSFTTEPINNNYISNPRDGATDVSAPSLKVTAGTVSGATRYTIELSTSPEFTDPFVRTSKVDNQRTLVFDSLAYNTKYYGRFKTNISGYGRVTSFTTKAEVFASLTEPAHQSASLHPMVVKLVTSSITGASRYTVQLNTTADFSGASIEVSSVEDDQTTFLVKDLKHATRYYARVKSDISTTFGPVTYFTTRNAIAQKRLWGVTTQGGAYDIGTMFSYSIDSGTFVKHYDYPDPHNENDYGERLQGSIIHGAKGLLYFHSATPSSSAYGGSLYEINNEGQVNFVKEISLYEGNMLLASDNHIYSSVNSHMTAGVIDKYGIDTDVWERIYAFPGMTRGIDPGSELLELHDGFLYGRATHGGINQGGTLYRLRYDGSGFQVTHFFDNATSGSNPTGDLVLGADGYFYGTTLYGGIYGHGTVYKIRPDGSNFTKLFDFDGTNGKRPEGGVIIKDNVLYGTTAEGGTNGTIFRINSDGSGFSNLHTFSFSDGYKPIAKLTIDNNVLYGITSGGGSGVSGVIFKINTNGTGFSTLYHLSRIDGAWSDGYLTLREDTFAPSATTFASQQEDVNVNVHPNPTATNFTLAFQSPDEDQVKVILTDMNGQVVHETMISSKEEYRLGDALNKGIYILKITRGEKTTMHRLVKK
jgi:uncharacterized repeat protein (TIGR03803 family)